MSKNAFIFGGGAARGLAHIGVAKAFYERGVLPSVIAGTSMGAIIGSLLAIGMTPHEIQKEVERLKILKMIDFSWAKAGLLTGDKIYNFLKKFLGQVSFENLKIPLRICAINIETGELHTFKSGRVIDAVRSSLSIPGVFLPYECNGSLYVDGGLTHNLPIQVLDEFQCENQFAFSVRRPKDAPIKYREYLESESSFKEIKYNRIDLTYNVLKKTIDLIMHNQEVQMLKDYPDVKLIVPNLDGIDYHDFHKSLEIINKGYEESKHFLEDHLQ